MSAVYFLDGLKDEQIDRINDAAIDYAETVHEVQVPPHFLQSLTGNNRAGKRAVNGLLFDEVNAQRAFAVLGARVLKVVDTGDEILIPELLFDQHPEPVLSIYSWPDECRAKMSEYQAIIQEELLAHIGVDIVLHAPGVPLCLEPNDDGRLHLYNWSSPKPENSLAEVATLSLWDCALPNATRAYHPSDEGLLLQDDADFPVAQLVRENHIYILFDLIRTGTQAEKEIFRRLCQEVHLHRNLDEQSRAEVIARRERESEAARREVYLQHCSHRVEKELKAQQTQLEAAESRLQKAQAAYIAAMQAAETAETLLIAKQARREEMLKAIQAEFDSFSRDPKILRVRPYEDGIRVDTRTLYFKHLQRDGVWELGEMQIDISLNADLKSDPIRIRNLSMIRRGSTGENPYPHPHIGTDGTPCYSASKRQFLELVLHRELYAATSLIIQFLETANDASYRGADEWPRVSSTELPGLREQGLLPAGV